MNNQSSAPSILAIVLLAVLGLSLLPTPVQPVVSSHASNTRQYNPPIEPASPEAQGALKSIQLDPGFSSELIAAEPLTANPVAFWLEPGGDVLVAETYRQSDPGGVPDNRDHVYWQDDDISCMNVDDRRRMYLKHHPEYAEKWTVHHDLIRRLRDTDGDGKLDEGVVLADGFNNILDGTGAGVISRGNKTWYACIPNLWMLEDTDGDGQADKRTSLHTGFGVRVALRGHDLHGLRFGPDGRLYFSIGDRGYNVTTHEGNHLFDPGSGAVFRCWPDGRELEVVATGLRNPQELCFDDYGNLFTGDNNSDSDDKARFVYVVEGAEIGWRMNFQYKSKRGPWVRENWWKPRFKNQATFLIPCIANIANGPSGLTFYPGVGMPEQYNGTFFLCDFHGPVKSSGVINISLEEDGAGFRLKEKHWFAKGVLATDTEFGPDGRLFTADWVESWVGVGKGRIQAYNHKDWGLPQRKRNAAAMNRDFSSMPVMDLLELLEHPDQRIRQEAQFALAEKGAPAIGALAGLLSRQGATIPRLHAIWGLGQLARRNPSAASAILLSMDDRDAEVRAQAARTLGDLRSKSAEESMISMLTDEKARPRFFAAIGLGRLRSTRATTHIIELLKSNADKDVYIRHACVMALTNTTETDSLLQLSDHASRSVRMGVLLALRKQRAPALVRFFKDSDQQIAVEAVRAAYDTFMPEARESVASLLGSKRLSSAPVQRRAIAARDILSSDEDVEALVAFSANTEISRDLRTEALYALESWHKPGIGDRALNTYAPRPDRDIEILRKEIEPRLPELLRDTATDIQRVAIRLATQLRLSSCLPELMRIVQAPEANDRNRAAALHALHKLGAPAMETHVRTALESDVPRLCAAATSILARLSPQLAIPILTSHLHDHSTPEHQSALSTLARMQNRESDNLLLGQLKLMASGGLPAAVELELMAAAQKRARDGVSRFAKWRDTSNDSEDPRISHRECLEGGDANRGRQIFEQNTAVSCKRCHALKKERGDLAGPALMDVGQRLSRGDLLSSIVKPNREITEGFGSVNLFTKNDKLFTGRIASETADSVTIITDDGEKTSLQVIARDNVDFRKKALSAMPTDIASKLTRRDIRDLVEFLWQQKGK